MEHLDKKNNKEEKLSDKVEKKLENQFQELNESTKLPEDLKKEVFNTLDTLTLLGDFVDLFTTKFGQAETDLIDTISNDDDDD